MLGPQTLPGPAVPFRTLGKECNISYTTRCSTSYIAHYIAGVLFGGGLLSQLWMNQVWIASPPSSFELIQPPIGNGLNAFFILFNSLMEWVLIPTAIFFNWRVPKRRTLIVATALIYYGMRVWTYLYFAPEIMTFYEMSPSEPFSPELAERAQQWVSLS